MNKPNPPPDESAGRNESEVQGEGDYRSARRYQREAHDFAANRDVERRAEEAAPRSDREAQEMRDAEARGRERSRGEDSCDVMKQSSRTRGDKSKPDGQKAGRGQP